MGLIDEVAARLNLPLRPSFTGGVIARNRLRVVDLLERPNGRYVLNALADLPVAAEEGEVGRLLAGIARRNSLAGRTLTLLAADRRVQVRQVEMPRMPHEELVDSLRFTEADALPFPMEDAVLDGFFMPGNGDDPRTPVLMAAMERATAERYHRMVAGSPFRHIGLTVVPAALEALLEHSRLIDADAPAPFISLSQDSAGVYIFQGGDLKFMRDIALGGEQLTEALAGDYNVAGNLVHVSLDEAEEIKRVMGIPQGDELHEVAHRGITGEMFLARLQAPLEKMVMEFGRSIDYFQNEYRSLDIPAVYLIGSAAQTRNLAAYLTEGLGYPFTVYNPFDDFVEIEKDELAALRAAGPAYAVTVGVALERGRRINLLPPRERYSFKAYLMKRLPAALAAFYLLAVAGVAAAGAAYKGKMEARIASVGADIAALAGEQDAGALMEAKAAALRNEMAAIDTRMTVYPKLEGRDIDWAAFYTELGIMMPRDMALDRLAVRFDGPEEYAADGEKYAKEVVMEGRIRGAAAAQVETLEEFLHSADASRCFVHATLINSHEGPAGIDGERMLMFTIAADIRRRGS